MRNLAFQATKNDVRELFTKKGTHKKTLSRTNSNKSKLIKGVKMSKILKEEQHNVVADHSSQVQPINTMETNAH